MITEEAAHPAAPSSIQLSFPKGEVKNQVTGKHRWPDGAIPNLLRDMGKAATMGCTESHCYAVLVREAFRAYHPVLSLFRGVFFTDGCRLRKVSDALGALEEAGLICRDYTRDERGQMRGPMKITVNALSGTHTNLHSAHNGQPISTESLIFTPATEELRIKEKRGKNNAPSLSDWLSYAKTIGFEINDAESAFNYYEARGWFFKCGSPVINWKACVRNCMTRAKSRLTEKQLQPTTKGIFHGCESPPTYKIMGFKSLGDWAKAGSPYPP